LLQIIEKINVEILIVSYNSALFEFLTKVRMNFKIILIGHLHLSYEAYRYVFKLTNISVVFPTKQTLLQYFDTPIYSKFGYIPYFITIPELNRVDQNYKNEKFYDITYIGSITKTKGFHLLAKKWTKITKLIPNARLNVIGSGKLYNPSQILGKYKISEEKYESSFIKYLVNKDGSIFDSVVFHGNLGVEKSSILERTRIGIVNPIAQSETFCLSVFDFTSKNVPVVTMKRFGLVDTVKDLENGLTYRYKFRFVKTIVKLHRNNKIYELIRNNSGTNFINKNFPLEKTIQKWIDLLNNDQFETVLALENLRENFNFLRVANNYLRKLIPILPPIVYYEFTYKKIRRTARIILLKFGVI